MGGVIRNHDSVITVLPVDLECPNHIDISLIQEHLMIMWNLSTNVSEMNISDIALPTVPIDRLIDVSFRHLCQCALAEFQSVVITRDNIEKSLVEMVLMDQPRRAA